MNQIDHRRQEVQQIVKNACDQLNAEGVEPTNRAVRQNRFVLGGEAVVLGVDWIISEFGALHLVSPITRCSLCVFRNARPPYAPGRGASPSAATAHTGRPRHWVKVKNRKHPPMERVMEAFG
jgi:hypothetical protein